MRKILTDKERKEKRKDNQRFFQYNDLVSEILDIKLAIAEIIVFISNVIKVRYQEFYLCSSDSSNNNLLTV